MIKVRIIARIAGSLVLILAAGCASQYHGYADCCVACGYCVPPPLPYTPYPGCVCRASAAAPYLWRPAEGSGPQMETDKDDVAGEDT
jgi:hypothetical protein